MWVMVDDAVICHAVAHRGYLTLALCDSLGSFWARVRLAFRVLFNRAEVTAISTFRSEKRVAN